jgi:cysteine synthase A
MPRNKTYDNIAQAIGETPMIRLNRVISPDQCTVFAKCEFFQPLNSVKDRIGAAMIEAGERDGKIKPGTVIVEPTSGNTGIALAFVCAAKGYKLILTMPESMSVERRALLRFMGAELVLTPAAEGMKGAIGKAQSIVETTPNAWMPQQFDNPANPAIHEKTTGPEIWEDSGHNIDAIVAGVGTGGTITGVSRFIKPLNPNFKAIAVEPVDSAVISGGKPGPHKIQGLGAGFIPKNLDTSLVDEVVLVSNEESF